MNLSTLSEMPGKWIKKSPGCQMLPQSPKE